jgi:acyl carrier protein
LDWQKRLSWCTRGQDGRSPRRTIGRKHARLKSASKATATPCTAATFVGSARGQCQGMTYDELCARIIQFIREEIPDKSVEITMDTPIEQVKIDSIDVIQVIFKAEEEFKVEIDVDTKVKYQTIGDFVRPIIAHIPHTEKN